jgi:glycine hydroxymethyltransferase
MFDQTIYELINQEKNRQKEGLELIPSENYVSKEVLDAIGSVLTNKYSEGYPGQRYYGGQIFIDQIEQIAIDRAKTIFRADHANVQPHSGASANEAVYYAWLEPGDNVLAMDLSHGGHLTHGSPVTRSAKLYNFIRYKMKNIETGEIDYQEIDQLAKKFHPKLIIVGYSSYPRQIDFEKIAQIGQQHGSLLMADMAHIAGLIAGGVADNPLDYGFHVMTCTSHKTLRGPRGGLIMSKGLVTSPLSKPKKEIANIPTLIDRAVFPGTQGGPHDNLIAAKAVALYEAMQPEFKIYAQQILTNAQALANELQKRKFHLITGGTSNHLILIDVFKSFNLSGLTVEKALDAINLTVNKNVIPDDQLSPFDPSGIRLGTPAITTRGLKEEQMVQIADWMERAIVNYDQPQLLQSIQKEVIEFAKDWPLPSD